MAFIFEGFVCCHFQLLKPLLCLVFSWPRFKNESDASKTRPLIKLISADKTVHVARTNWPVQEGEELLEEKPRLFKATVHNLLLIM